MWDWLRAVLSGKRTASSASTGGVVVEGDNYGLIATGPLTVQAPDEPTDEALRRLAAAQTRNVFLQIAATRLLHRTIVPVTLIEARDEGDQAEAGGSGMSSSLVTMDNVVNWLVDQQTVVVWGEGGIGKTTVAIEIAQRLLIDSPAQRIPLFLDASAWAASSDTPLDYIAKQVAFAGHNLTAPRLARLAQLGHVVLIVDGWNEIDATKVVQALPRMRAFLEGASPIGILMTSRKEGQQPITGDAHRIRVQGINWRHQREYIQSALSATQATSLIDMLAVRHDLRHAARNALILSGMVTRHASGGSIEGRFGIYGAIVADYEAQPVRQAALQAPAVGGFQAPFLEAIASRMTDDGGTALSMEVAHEVVMAEVRLLQARGQLAGMMEPTTVVRCLLDQHLLFSVGGRIRFAHQRLQEYFAARRCIDWLAGRPLEGAVRSLLSAINHPAWEDALLLVAEELSLDPLATDARVALLRSALTVDLHFCCVLVAECGFSSRDDVALHQAIVDTVAALMAADDPMVRDFGFACAIDSELPSFGAALEAHLQQSDRSQRLHLYRLGQNPLALHQFGDDVAARLETWGEQRCVELIHEVAGNRANWSVLRDWAFAAKDDAVRAAAISALAWEYPASRAPLEAWLAASDAVKMHGELLNIIAEDVVGGYDPPLVTALQELYARLPSDPADHLALRFPTLLPAPPLESLLRRLSDPDRLADPRDPFLLTVERISPESMRTLATELLLSPNPPPHWAMQAIQSWAPAERSALFAQAEVKLAQDPHTIAALGAIASCADLGQVMHTLLQYSELTAQLIDRRPTDPERERYLLLRELLHEADGERLLEAVLSSTGQASCEELVGLIAHRSNPEYGGRDRSPWAPTPDQVHALIGAFDTAAASSDTYVALAQIASRAAPDGFVTFLIDCCRRELAAWEKYQRALADWLANAGRTTRPRNPGQSWQLAAAIARCGFEALPGLLGLIEHPEADHFIYRAIAAILQEPWSPQDAQIPLHRSCPDARAALHRRHLHRVLLQPDNKHQEITDAAARRLVVCLEAEAAQAATSPSGHVSHIRATARVAEGAKTLARMPSTAGLQFLLRLIAKGRLADAVALDVVCSLVNQGWSVDDVTMERLREARRRLAEVTWPDNQQRHQWSVINRVLLLATDINFDDDDLNRWVRTSGMHEVIQSIVDARTPQGFGLLGRLLTAESRGQGPIDVVINGMANLLAPENLQELIHLVDGDALFAQPDSWQLGQLADAVARLARSEPSRLVSLLRACLANGAPQAIRWGCQCLVAYGAGDAMAAEYARNATLVSKVIDARLPRAFLGLFVRQSELGPNTYEIVPTASNQLRLFFYRAITSNSPWTPGAKALLCDIEVNRRENYRPANETRHPALQDGHAWSDVLIR